jgi:hypothetical protein
VSEEPALRLRCPEDIERPDPTGGHVRVDVYQPVAPKLLLGLVRAISPCACGKRLVFLADGERDPWRDHA